MNNDKVRISVSIDFPHYAEKSMAVVLPISGPFVLQYKPIDWCDDAFSLMFATKNPILKSEATIQMVARRRKKYADILAKEISAAIVEQMGNRDTYNGYPIEGEAK